MRTFNLHAKSLLVGLAAGLLLFAAIGADPSPAPPAPTAAAAQPGQAGVNLNARDGDQFELAAWGNQDGHGAFVLNTRTGEVVSIIGRTVSAAGTANVETEQKRVGLYSVQQVQR